MNDDKVVVLHKSDVSGKAESNPLHCLSAGMHSILTGFLRRHWRNLLREDSFTNTEISSIWIPIRKKFRRWKALEKNPMRT